MQDFFLNIVWLVLLLPLLACVINGHALTHLAHVADVLRSGGIMDARVVHTVNDRA